MLGLTHQQRECLIAVRDLTVDGVSPSYCDIRERLGLASNNGVSRLLRGLKARGYVDFEPGIARTVIIRRYPEGVAPNLKGLDAPTLRSVIAKAAGLLAHQTSEAECADVLRRAADRVSHQPKVAA